MEKTSDVNSSKLVWIKPQIQEIDFHQTAGGKPADAVESGFKGIS